MDIRYTYIYAFGNNYHMSIVPMSTFEEQDDDTDDIADSTDPNFTPVDPIEPHLRRYN